MPENKSAAKDIYLPFSEKDDKMTEIISKIFLLVDDELITDTEIISQINRKI